MSDALSLTTQFEQVPCTDLGLAVPVPDTWLHENLTGKDIPQVSHIFQPGPGPLPGITSPRTFFNVGLIRRAAALESLQETTSHYMELDPHRALEAPVVYERDNLQIYRRAFVATKENIPTLDTDVKTVQLGVIIHRTGLYACLSVFETPRNQTDTYLPLARTMLSGITQLKSTEQQI